DRELFLAAPPSPNPLDLRERILVQPTALHAPAKEGARLGQRPAVRVDRPGPNLRPVVASHERWREFPQFQRLVRKEAAQPDLSGGDRSLLVALVDPLVGLVVVERLADRPADLDPRGDLQELRPATRFRFRRKVLNRS